MSGAIPPLLQYVFMAWCLVKPRKIKLETSSLIGTDYYVTNVWLITARFCVPCSVWTIKVPHAEHVNMQHLAFSKQHYGCQK
jgi:hypothetical protein